MRNAILGGFLGFLLASGVLAACGGGGPGPTSSLTVDELAVRVAALEALLASVERTESGALMLRDETVILEGGNLIVRNGEGSTASTNGRGNLIIGYNAFRVTGNDRSGSHMLVVGDGLNFSSYGGIVAGHVNSAEAPFACVTGGYRNVASGAYASVTGGSFNEASGDYASVTGGFEGLASGESAAVSGGWSNEAWGRRSCVAGGADNLAAGWESAILGGRENEISTDGEDACVSGGRGHLANAYAASITGGRDNAVTGQYGSVTGGRSNHVAPDPVTISAGCATISGGYDWRLEGQHDWRGGTYFSDD